MTINSRFLAAFIVVGLGSALNGQTPPINEIGALREEMQLLRRDYEARMKVLEERLRRLEGTNVVRVENSANTNTPAAGASSSNSIAALIPTAPSASTNQSTAVSSFNPVQSRTFRRGTESRQRAIIAGQEEAFRERIEEVLSGFVDISGYFRAGYGGNDKDTSQVGFRAPGAFSKYRLGNEAEVYGELGFGKDFYLPKLFSTNPSERPKSDLTGPIAHVQLLMSAYNPYQDLLTASGTDFGLPEAWASIGNVVPTQPELKFWAGTRFFRRHDIHIMDLFFYNMSGAGGGIEDIQLPFGKAAISWIGAGAQSGFSELPEPDPQNEAGFNKDNLDFRIYDVPVPLGKGEFGIVLARATAGTDSAGNSVPDTEGISFTALHTREKFISYDGVNKFSVQFGTGPAKTFTSGFETFPFNNGLFIRSDPRDSWRFRVTEHFTANLSSHFSISPALVYQITDYAQANGSRKVEWASAGVRPIIHFNRYLSLALEGGVDWVRDEAAGTSDYLYKLTVCPQVSLGNRFMSRPVIRLFLTHAAWGDDFVGQVGGADYLNSDNGWSYGMQMEAWW